MNVKFIDDDVIEFITLLNKSSKARVVRTLELLKEFGNNLRLPYSKALGKNLFELRIKGKQEIRLFYTYYNSNAVILHGFVKKTQKTPQKEITIALKKLKILLI